MIPTHGLAPRASDGASQSEWPINPVKITVDKNGHAWVADINGGIWRYMGPNYIKVDGYAVDIAAGGDGSIYTVDAYNEIVIPALTTVWNPIHVQSGLISYQYQTGDNYLNNGAANKVSNYFPSDMLKRQKIFNDDPESVIANTCINTSTGNINS